MEQAPLYKDKLIEISNDFIILRNYYFPFGSKRIPLEEIESITVEKPSLSAGKWRIWGTGNLTTWFPLDLERPSRDRIFLVSIQGKGIRIGFTAENSEAVFRILEQKGAIQHSSA